MASRLALIVKIRVLGRDVGTANHDPGRFQGSLPPVRDACSMQSAQFPASSHGDH